jgi:hypothetical protein
MLCIRTRENNCPTESLGRASKEAAGQAEVKLGRRSKKKDKVKKIIKRENKKSKKNSKKCTDSFFKNI